jgi:hypothetical protein
MQQTPQDQEFPRGWFRPIRTTSVRPKEFGWIPIDVWIYIALPALWLFGVGYWTLAGYVVAILYSAAFVASRLEPFWFEITQQLLATALTRLVATRGRFGNPFRYLAPR